MNNEEIAEIRASIITLWKGILDAQASTQATRAVFNLLSTLPDFPEDAKKIISSYDGFYDDFYEKNLLLIDKLSPSIAAEIDADRGPKPPKL
jgi:hypothetical protein